MLWGPALWVVAAIFIVSFRKQIYEASASSEWRRLVAWILPIPMSIALIGAAAGLFISTYSTYRHNQALISAGLVRTLTGPVSGLRSSIPHRVPQAFTIDGRTFVYQKYSYLGLPRYADPDLPIHEGECVRIGYLETLEDRSPPGDRIVKLETNPSGTACRT
jgi:hypothetical protein